MLLVQLPCAEGHSGGSLVVEHSGRTMQLDTAQVGGWDCRGMPLCAMLPSCPQGLKACL